MSYFTVDQAAELAKSTVYCATLADLEFTGALTYLWNGFGSRVFDGKTYQGCGDLGSIEGLEETRGAVSQQVTFTLSGVPDSPAGLLASALDSSDIIQGNLAVVSLQLFDADWNPVGDPAPIYFGVMMPPRVTRDPASSIEGAKRTLTLPTENIFYGRHRPAAGRFTDREQQQRFSGDQFCEFTPQLVNLSLTWPDY